MQTVSKEQIIELKTVAKRNSMLRSEVTATYLSKENFVPHYTKTQKKTLQAFTRIIAKTFQTYSRIKMSLSIKQMNNTPLTHIFS